MLLFLLSFRIVFVVVVFVTIGVLSGSAHKESDIRVYVRVCVYIFIHDIILYATYVCIYFVSILRYDVDHHVCKMVCARINLLQEVNGVVRKKRDSKKIEKTDRMKCECVCAFGIRWRRKEICGTTKTSITVSQLIGVHFIFECISLFQMLVRAYYYCWCCCRRCCRCRCRITILFFWFFVFQF